MDVWISAVTSGAIGIAGAIAGGLASFFGPVVLESKRRKREKQDRLTAAIVEYFDSMISIAMEPSGSPIPPELHRRGNRASLAILSELDRGDDAADGWLHGLDVYQYARHYGYGNVAVSGMVQGARMMLAWSRTGKKETGLVPFTLVLNERGVIDASPRSSIEGWPTIAEIRALPGKLGMSG